MIRGKLRKALAALIPLAMLAGLVATVACAASASEERAALEEARAEGYMDGRTDGWFAAAEHYNGDGAAGDGAQESAALDDARRLALGVCLESLLGSVDTELLLAAARYPDLSDAERMAVRARVDYSTGDRTACVAWMDSDRR